MPQPSPWGKGTRKSEKEKAQSIIKAFGAMYYAEARAVQGYTGDARKWTQRALDDLKDAGQNPEDMKSTVEPLQEIVDAPTGGLNQAQVQARLNDAEWDLLDWAPKAIAVIMR